MPIKHEPQESPGFKRLKENLGPEGFEALRQDTLRRQEEALAGVRNPTKPKRANRAHEAVRNVIRGKRT